VCPQNQFARKALRSLRAPESIARHGARHPPAVGDLFQRVDDRQRGGHRAAGTRLRHDTVDRRVPDERPGRIVNEHDPGLVGEVLQAVEYRVSPCSSADRDEQPIEVRLEQPRGWIAGVSQRQDADDGEDVHALHKGLHTMEQHRLPRDPPKLLRLGATRAGAQSGGGDDDTDVARDVGGARPTHPKRRPNSSAIVRTPTTSISRAPRFGTLRSAT
jgi:hypothetical protein